MGIASGRRPGSAVGGAPGLTCSSTHPADVVHKEGDQDTPPSSMIRGSCSPPSRMTSQTSVESGVISGLASVSVTCDALERLRAAKRQNDVYLPANWATDRSNGKFHATPVERPSLPSLRSVKVSGNATPEGALYHPPRDAKATLFSPHPGSGSCSSIPSDAGHLGLVSLAPPRVRRPRDGVHPDTYPFGALRKTKQPIQNDPMELATEMMGEPPNATKDLGIERPQ